MNLNIHSYGVNLLQKDYILYTIVCMLTFLYIVNILGMQAVYIYIYTYN